VLVQHRLDFLEIVSGMQPDAAIARVKASLQEYFPIAIADGSFAGIVARDGSGIVATGGMIVYLRPANFNSANGKVGYILNMYTLAAYRRRGIGGEIMKRLIDIAKELSIDIVELHASADGETLYRKFGFHPHPVLNMVLKLDS
jgi:GNAT superfamily N-acetyltransferase